MVADLSRLFVAADLTPEARVDLAHLLGGWAPRGLPGRIVPAENWHITLRFLGEADDVACDRIMAGLEADIGGGPVRMALSTPGAFPRASRATVLWLGVGRGADRLTELAETVEGVSVDAGFVPEDRPFAPHLTLSRIRPAQDLRPLLDHPLGGQVQFDLRALTLFRSDLGQAGARYQAVELFPLA